MGLGLGLGGQGWGERRLRLDAVVGPACWKYAPDLGAWVRVGVGFGLGKAWRLG